MSSATPNPAGLFSSHPRHFRQNRYVYPVVSRRAGGVSIGVNLNPDKACNFDCVYCQVDRHLPGTRPFVDLQQLATELDAALADALSGRLFEDPAFAATPPALRRVNDIALSGDGEPTTYRNFEQVVEVCGAARQRAACPELKVVLITNASMFHRPGVQRALDRLDRCGGEIWAKLDAGTEQYYRRIARTAVPFSRILDNLRSAARKRPIVIQSLFLRLAGQGPSMDEQEAYCQRLAEITAAGGKIKLVQVHTIARKPAEPSVTPLDRAELESLADRVRRRVGLRVEVY